MKRVAIIGAGMCGLAVAYFLRHLNVTVFDPMGVGGGASRVCGGLIHPFRGLECLPAMLEAFNIARPFLGEHLRGPLVRMPKKQEIFTPTIDAADYTGGKIHGPARLIERGGMVDTPAYLQSLFAKAQCQLVEREIEDIRELEDFDEIVVAAGAGALRFLSLSCELIHGRALLYDLEPLDHGVLGEVYFAESHGRLVVGATYEHAIKESHLKKLRECATLMMPQLAGHCGDVVMGTRVSGPGRKPFAGAIADRLWAIGGMGGRGLLYHVAYAQKLAKEIAGE